MISCRPFALRVLLLSLLLPAAGLFAQKQTGAKSAPAPDYRGAIVMDATTGTVLLEDQADTVSPPASMVKLMTFAVVYDRLQNGTLSLDTTVQVTAADSKIGGTQVWLKEKEIFPVEELIYAMMIQSANDAAYALARTVGGSIEAFVGLMNAKARDLGMTRTTFRTAHGLPPSNRRIEEGDLTTPRDFALLSRHLLLRTDILRYTSVKTRPFGAGSRPEPVVMNNHNNLLNKVSGVDGLKTGFTNGAGFCLTATAQRNGRRVIAVVMGSPASRTRDLKVTELLERGFAALPADSPAFDPRTAELRPAKPAATHSPISHAPLTAGEKAASAPSGTQPQAEPVIKFSVPGKKK